MGDGGVEFFVPGIPAPGGSKRAFAHASTGKVVVMDDAKRNKDWRATVALAGAHAMAGRPPFKGPLVVRMEFKVPRPKGHYRTGVNASAVRPSAPDYPAKKPDVLKLARSTEDALTGICWEDDSQTIGLMLTKFYAGDDAPGVRVVVMPAEQAMPSEDES